MADTLGGHSDHVVDTAGHSNMASSDGHESAVTQHAHQSDRSADQTDRSADQTDRSEQQQETAENTERRRRTAVFVHGPVLTVRDRVFHALFYRLALIYARVVPHQLRRVIEFTLLFEVLQHQQLASVTDVIICPW